MSESELVQQARDEARALIAEAEEQARTILEAAEKRRLNTEHGTLEIKQAGQELARNIERSIDLLTQILEDLRGQLE